ncbi:DUF6602 domain-containing protein [Sulfobacillus thermosulfidooxidans]|uniref:DUF6602 domain-containing protein n=1 Tax=Sulfobacillus thermosulfidooxidans TaxID=28034 RepID=UPI000ADD3D3F|nr:DUF6602 domain-containing protein [Sulfobacillus thermosulfidooxidans]
MLVEHINAYENKLLAISRIPDNSGHSLHKGTPREAFIKEFLQSHLSELIGFGNGEIIDCDSQPNQQRNQVDIVLYKKNYPKLDFGGGINGFFVESVVATIEVKSALTEGELTAAFNSIRNTKSLQRNMVTSFYTGYQPPGIFSCIVAYDGPANMSTVYGWINRYVQNNNITMPSMAPDLKSRMNIPSPLADLIVILGKGFVQFDNSPITFLSDAHRAQDPTKKWLVSTGQDGNLLMLFSHLTVALSGVSASWMNVIPYLANVQRSNFDFFP